MELFSGLFLEIAKICFRNKLSFLMIDKWASERFRFGFNSTLLVIVLLLPLDIMYKWKIITYIIADSWLSHASQNGNLMSFIITVCSVVATTGVIKYFVPFLKQYEELGFSRKIKRFLLKMPDSKLNNIVNEKMVFEEFSDIEFCITNSGGDLIKEIELEAVEKNNLKNYKISEDMLNTKKAYFNISFFQFLFLLRIFFGNSFKKNIEDIQKIKQFIISECNDDDLKNIFYQLNHKDDSKIIPDKTYNVIKNDDNKRINQDFFDLVMYPFIYIERANYDPCFSTCLSTCLQINIGNLQRKFFPYWFMDMELIKDINSISFETKKELLIFI